MSSSNATVWGQLAVYSTLVEQQYRMLCLQTSDLSVAWWNRHGSSFAGRVVQVRRQRCLQGKAPQYLVNCCHPTSNVASRQRLRSSSRHHLVVPRHRRSTLGRRAFSVAGPMAWNALPDDLRDPSLSADNFRNALKTHLFWNALGHLAH